VTRVARGAVANRWREVATFGVVGAAAFAVHFAVVAALVPRGLPPLAANVVAFVAAFGVSFAGHARWSFPAAERPALPALMKFSAVAVGAFALNEACYAMLLRWTHLDYRTALVLVLAAVAALTYVAGRAWAFAVPPAGARRRA
jgi:putative flippase GtrA